MPPQLVPTDPPIGPTSSPARGEASPSYSVLLHRLRADRASRRGAEPVVQRGASDDHEDDAFLPVTAADEEASFVPSTADVRVDQRRVGRPPGSSIRPANRRRSTPGLRVPGSRVGASATVLPPTCAAALSARGHGVMSAPARQRLCNLELVASLRAR